jgi:hypothetical protein
MKAIILLAMAISLQTHAEPKTSKFEVIPNQRDWHIGLIGEIPEFGLFNSPFVSFKARPFRLSMNFVMVYQEYDYQNGNRGTRFLGICEQRHSESVEQCMTNDRCGLYAALKWRVFSNHVLGSFDVTGIAKNLKAQTNALAEIAQLCERRYEQYPEPVQATSYNGPTPTPAPFRINR